MAIDANDVHVSIVRELTPVFLRVGDQEARVGDVTGDTPAELFRNLAELLRAAADEYEAGPG